jgi:membrane fusion protein, macrolide-specific efflux system
VTAAEDSIGEGAQTNSVTVAEDQATVTEDEATVANDQKILAETTLTSPIAGTVTAVNGTVGQTVGGGSSSNSSNSSNSGSAGSAASAFAGTSSSSSSNSSSSSSSAFATITNLSSLDVVAGFPEADVTKVTVGQPATITLPALPNTDVPGKVVSVSPTSTVSSDVVTYDVQIDLTDPPASVKDGMTADVGVITASRSGVLLVPSSAITTTGTRSTVTVLANGKQTVEPVTLGLVGTSDTQILSGLKTGETVVIPTVSVTPSTSSSSTSPFGGGGLFGGRGGGL